MIHYQLRCDAGHEFESWFRSGAVFDAQVAAGLVECPSCASTAVTRGLMAPAIAKGRKAKTVQRQGQTGEQPPTKAEAPVAVPSPNMPAEMRAVLQRMRSEIERNCDNVGARFADEARAIHRGDAPDRGNYGETTPDQAEALADEGIALTRIPWLPRADG